ncbi:insulin receptor [Procambarus clarkii]|uniref:insulin receptor n=1 Tax=Procambarus clarkii TaxID=6728 RepID=UPI003742786A
MSIFPLIICFMRSPVMSISLCFAFSIPFLDSNNIPFSLAPTILSPAATVIQLNLLLKYPCIYEQLGDRDNTSRYVSKTSYMSYYLSKLSNFFCVDETARVSIPHRKCLSMWWWVFFIVLINLGITMCSANASLSTFQDSMGQLSQLESKEQVFATPVSSITRSTLQEVCESKRIINSVNELETLRNCRVIEGNLQIILIEDAKQINEWKKWSFPELVQITGFLLIYRVSGLRSLGQLFPNLAVIRGMTLHQNYALVIYDAMDLESVDLYSLTDILRGGVRIQNNFNLCYVNEVNWSIIIKDASDNVFKNNNERLCGPCHPNCPRQGKLEHCWSAKHCQQVCEQKCEGGCTPNGECCHYECVGGCKMANNPSSCSACRHFNSSGTCSKTCFYSFYEYHKYKCVSKKDCSEMGLLLYESEDRSRRECVKVCPAGYSNETEQVRNKTVMTCRKCVEPCAKTCPGQLVNTVAKAQRLIDCTKIEGPLIISITGGTSIAKELNVSLGLIEEVTDYVRVFGSRALLSLNFLASLKVIGGRKLYNGKYALYVHDNDNLEEIWSWENHADFTIAEKNATVLFHSNPKLCYKKIKELIERTKRKIPEDCNMQLTNGNKIACTIMEQTVTVEALPEEGTVRVSWTTAPINEDDRMLTGYYVYYKPSESMDIGYMTGRDACDDDWARKYVEITKSEVNISTHLKDLQADTQYAIYVQTDTVVDADSSAKSKINFIKTLPCNPSSPRNLQVDHVGTSWLTASWTPPTSPNGKVNLYVVRSRLDLYRVDTTTDFCSSLLSHTPRSDLKQSGKDPTSTTTLSPTSEKSDDEGSGSGKCCKCSPDMVHTEQQEDIDFEDRLFSYVYMRRSNRKKRSNADFHHQEEESSILRSRSPCIYTDLSNVNNSFQKGVKVFFHKEQRINITNLRQFSRYEIEVTACHEPTDNCPRGSGMKSCALCSFHPLKIVETTLRLAGGNLVRELRVSNSSKPGVKVVAWSPPTEPNSQVVAYMLTIQPENIFMQFSPNERCVSSQVFEENNNTYNLNVTLMEPGSYWVSVRPYTRDAEDLYESSVQVLFSIEGGEEESSHDMKLWPVLTVLLVLLLFGTSFLIFKMKSRKEPVKETLNPHYHHETGPLWTPDVYAMISSQHILDCSNLLLEESCQLGKGHFGIVMKGQLRLESGLTPVAVKQVTNYQARDDILQEAKLMLKLNCYHLVHAYGVVPGPNHMLLVMELMSRGDLQKYLRSLKAQDDDIFSVLSVDHACAMAIQIADGMAYLASHKIVHRDLAARNCLVDDQLNIKISDFGMTRLTDNDYYKIRETRYFPVRWLPPECLISSKFTSQSDVWSYGVVLWEILSGGAQPYKHLKDNSKVWEKVSQGYSLETHLPRDTPTFLAKVTVSCWRFHGCQRPYFPQIIAALLPSASPCFLQHFRMVSFYHSPEGQEYKQLVETMQEIEVDNITAPLATISPAPLTQETSPQAPPLPPRPPSGLKWRPSFRLRGQNMRKCTRHSSFSCTTTDITRALSLDQQGAVDTNAIGTNIQGQHATSSALNSVISTDVNSTESSNIISTTMKSSSIFPNLLENRKGEVARYKGKEDNITVTLPTPTPSNMIVHINKHGLPCTTISSANVESSDTVLECFPV